MWSGEGREGRQEETRKRPEEHLLTAETPAFSIYNISSFLLLRVNPTIPKIKCRKQPEKCCQGMTGLPPWSRQVFLGEAGLHRKSNKKRACTPQYPPDPQSTEKE